MTKSCAFETSSTPVASALPPRLSSLLDPAYSTVNGALTEAGLQGIAQKARVDAEIYGSPLLSIEEWTSVLMYLPLAEIDRQVRRKNPAFYTTLVTDIARCKMGGRRRPKVLLAYVERYWLFHPEEIRR